MFLSAVRQHRRGPIRRLLGLCGRPVRVCVLAAGEAREQEHPH